MMQCYVCSNDEEAERWCVKLQLLRMEAAPGPVGPSTGRLTSLLIFGLLGRRKKGNQSTSAGIREVF